MPGLNESMRDWACAQPFRSSQLGRDEKRGTNKNTMLVKVLHVIRKVQKAWGRQRRECCDVLVEEAA